MLDIPGFNTKITRETLAISTRLHNQFHPDSDFPKTHNGFEDLCTIIVKYNVQHYFRLRLLHRHISLPEGKILVGSRTGTRQPTGYWTRPICVSNIDPQSIHGHIFSIDTTTEKSALLSPSEFRDGPQISTEGIDINFFMEFTKYLRENGLANTFGLEVIQGQAGKMIEFSFDIGSLLLEEEEVKAEVREEVGGQFKLQETGWIITVKDGTVYKTGVIECVKANGEHRPVAVPSKVTKVSDIVKILRDRDILVM